MNECGLSYYAEEGDDVEPEKVDAVLANEIRKREADLHEKQMNQALNLPVVILIEALQSIGYKIEPPEPETTDYAGKWVHDSP